MLSVTLKVGVWPDSPGPALMFVAQLGTLCGPASSSTFWSGPLVKLGASFTAFTVMVKVSGVLVSCPPLAVPPSSWSSSVMSAEPLASSAGVYVSAPVASTPGPAANRPELVLPVMLKVSAWPDSSAGPALIFVAQLGTFWAPASSVTLWSGPLVKLGASFTGFTDTTRLNGGLGSVPSWTVTGTVSGPL